MNRIPESLMQYIAEEASRIHHGTIRIEINADKPGKFDVITEKRERFSTRNSPCQPAIDTVT